MCIFISGQQQQDFYCVQIPNFRSIFKKNGQQEEEPSPTIITKFDILLSMSAGGPFYNRLLGCSWTWCRFIKFIAISLEPQVWDPSRRANGGTITNSTH
jgi:hypothetical protein